MDAYIAGDERLRGTMYNLTSDTSETSTLTEESSNSSAQLNRDSLYFETSKPSEFDTYFGIWIPGVICISGIVGNIIVLIVLLHDRKNVMFQTLKALATSDTILLISALFQQVIPMFCLKSESTSAFCRSQGYLRVYTWPLVCITQMVSVHLIVLISVERFVAIVLPFKTTTLCTLQRINFTICSIWIFSVLFNFPKFFEFNPVPSVDRNTNYTYIIMGSTDLRENIVYRYFYNTALNCIILYALPLLFLIILSFKTIHTIHKARRTWEQLNRRQQKELQATKMPLVIISVFFVCGTQALLGFVLDAIFLSSNLRWLQIYTAVVNLLVMLNAAINCILMYLFGQKFRAMLKDVFTCQADQWKNRNSYRYTSNMSRNSSFKFSDSRDNGKSPVQL